MRIISVSNQHNSIIQAAHNTAEIIKQGEIVIAPTETTYGLIADAQNSEAVGRLFDLKRRPKDKPTAIFVESYNEIMSYAEEVAGEVLAAIKKLWPGPVTFVFKSKVEKWPGVVSSQRKIGLRCSSHPFIMKLVEIYDSPLTATSANISGMLMTSNDDLKNTFGDKLALFILDPALNFDNLPSTVVEISGNKADILRHGMVEKQSIKEIFANVRNT